jgi:hypothetical protein
MKSFVVVELVVLLLAHHCDRAQLVIVFVAPLSWRPKMPLRYIWHAAAELLFDL